MQLNPADFRLLPASHPAGDRYCACVLCGARFRFAAAGRIRYNHQELAHCPYCVAWAAGPRLPLAVARFQAQARQARTPGGSQWRP